MEVLPKSSKSVPMTILSPTRFKINLALNQSHSIGIGSQEGIPSKSSPSLAIFGFTPLGTARGEENWPYLPGIGSGGEFALWASRWKEESLFPIEISALFLDAAPAEEENRMKKNIKKTENFLTKFGFSLI